MRSDRDYFFARAKEEDARAAQAENEAAQEAHRRMAEQFRTVAANGGPKPAPSRPQGKLTIL